MCIRDSSHTAAYYTLRDIRGRLTGKLARVPMGTILDTPSGQYKTTIVDRVEGMESTFAPVSYTHLDVYKRQPDRYAEHDTHKAVSIKIVGTVVCGMVKQLSLIHISG